MTKAMPTAASTRSPTSWSVTLGTAGVGKPEGIAPTTDTPCAVRSKTRTAAAAPTTARNTPGTRGDHRAHTKITAERAEAHDERRGNGVAVEHTAHEGLGLPEQTGRVGAEPEQRRELAHEHYQRDAVEEPDAHRLREQVGQRPEPREARDDAHDADQQRERTGERDRLLRITVRADQRQHGRGDERGDGGVGPEHEDPGRTEDRVGQQRDDGRVQTRHRRQTGELGVRHPLREQERGQRDAGNEVTAQPSPLIRPRQAEPGRSGSRTRRHTSSILAPSGSGQRPMSPARGGGAERATARRPGGIGGP